MTVPGTIICALMAAIAGLHEQRIEIFFYLARPRTVQPYPPISNILVMAILHLPSTHWDILYYLVL